MPKFYTSLEMRVLITASDEDEARFRLASATREISQKPYHVELKGMDIIEMTREISQKPYQVELKGMDIIEMTEE